MPIGIRSTLVDKDPAVCTPFIGSDPTFKPFNVMVTELKAAMAAVAVVITMTFDDGVEIVPVKAPLINTVVFETELKKPVG